MSGKHDSSLRDELILMKLDTVVVYYLRIWFQEDKTGSEIVQGRNSREIISTADGHIICHLAHSSRYIDCWFMFIP